MININTLFFGSSLFPVGKVEFRKIAPRAKYRRRRSDNRWALGGQAWPVGKTCGEISGLGVEGGGNFGAVTEVKHPDRAGRQ